MTYLDIIQKIEAYATAAGLAPATVTSRSVGNSRLYHSLVEGKGCTIRIAEKISAWMDANPPAERQAAE